MILTATVLILFLLNSVSAEDCVPERKCLTCPPGLPFHCTSCEKGFHLQRGGAYLSCEPCPISCLECDNHFTCTHCVIGRYGSVCQDVCGKGCINSTCDQYIGLCGCKTNFSGVNCDRCANGKYGYQFDDCELSCPANCKTCLSDKNCTQCKEGFYGVTCDKLCSSGCYSGQCEQRNGTCIENECKPNFEGDKCDNCTAGHYGKDCESCPKNCESCISNFTCNVCKKGYWGTACKNNCSLGCYGDTCSKETGVCTNGRCKSGFTGNTCTNCIAGLRGIMCSINETHTAENKSSAVVQVNGLIVQWFIIVVQITFKALTG